MNTKKNIFLLVLLISILLCYQECAAGIPAFPGAEGFGANSVGGRGGTVIKVTNLNDSGPGSFRDAVSASGPRIVVFDVSGIINLKSQLLINKPYLTIAGQTSPGGILITGYMTLLKQVHDVVVQHMRFRVGSHRISDGADPETLDSFDIWGHSSDQTRIVTYNIIIDHCSFSWGVDETFATAYSPTDITIQWSIFAEGLNQGGHPKGEHSKGLLFWGANFAQPSLISLHHNYFVHNIDRNPLINGINSFLDAVNNVVYNFFGGYGLRSGGAGVKVNWVHNYVKKGPLSNDNVRECSHNNSSGVPPEPNIYVKGNCGSSRRCQYPDNQLDPDPEWCVGDNWMYVLIDQGWQATTRWPAPAVTTAIMSDSVASSILTGVGATVPVRDSVDLRVIKDFHDGTGAAMDNVVYPDDFPTFATPAPPTDSDNDGMPDTWELSNGYDINIDDSALDDDNDGYTNIEEYLHYLAGLGTVTDTTPPAPPTNVHIP